MTRANDLDRGIGVLTTKQREYLLGESDTEAGSNAERMLRSRIRDRIRNAILDFSLLATELRNDDRNQIFESDQDPLSDFNRGIANLFSFIYTGVEDKSEFESLLETGITWAEIRQNPVEQTPPIDVDVTVDVNRSMEFDMEEVLDYVERGEFDKIPPAAALTFLKASDAAREMVEAIQKVEEDNTDLDEVMEIITEFDKDRLSNENLDIKDEDASDESGS